jgi:predicted O-linked N-acetylglucosamine transferase (SPINDLY family)
MINADVPLLDASPVAKTIQQAERWLLQGNYPKAAVLYEQAIIDCPTQVSLYWYLGLTLLLQNKESEAQAIWMTPLLVAEPEQAAQWTDDLVQILRLEARRQQNNAAHETAWLIRQYIREFAPGDLENLLQLLIQGLRLKIFSLDDGLLQHLNQTLASIEPSTCSVQLDLLLQGIESLLEFAPASTEVFNFLEQCASHFVTTGYLEEFVKIIIKVVDCCRADFPDVDFSNLYRFCVQLALNDVQILLKLIPVLQANTGCLSESIPLAERALELSTAYGDRVLASHCVLNGLMMTCSPWQKTHHYFQIHRSLLHSIQSETSRNDLYRLLAIGMLFHYFADAPAIDRPIRNTVGRIAQEHYRLDLTGQIDLDHYHYQHQQQAQPQAQPQAQQHHTNYSTATAARAFAAKALKVGYLSDCLRLHSVGWLVRWLLKYHDRERFDVHLYSMTRTADSIQRSFVEAYGENFHHLLPVPEEVAEQIYRDKIDILIDLDSLTCFTNCAVLARKPAPIQVSWLGFDATGLPAVDYFIADPYVLPDDAQTYYSETIWRLPQTYVAVDGFEIGVPDLRREHLEIPADAIVYLSSQSGLKRNPDNVRVQLQIIKATPNSYFLVKSLGAQMHLLKSFFYEIAEAEGISSDRLRFLPDVPANAVYRANLRLADVVLDTYPYNGATTTLEALWVGLPVVTRVGQQFAARNSYTMLMNVGVTEGIAWTDEEYIQWGIRLGTDMELRQDIFYRLQQSRHVSPLWNSKRFTREMERAYEQMWEGR